MLRPAVAAAGYCTHTHTHTHTLCILNCSCQFPACPLGRLPILACPPDEERLLCQPAHAVLAKDEVHIPHVHRLACHNGDTKLHKSCKRVVEGANMMCLLQAEGVLGSRRAGRQPPAARIHGPAS
jgi:hypothetical protein